MSTSKINRACLHKNPGSLGNPSTSPLIFQEILPGGACHCSFSVFSAHRLRLSSHVPSPSFPCIDSAFSTRYLLLQIHANCWSHCRAFAPTAIALEEQTFRGQLLTRVFCGRTVHRSFSASPQSIGREKEKDAELNRGHTKTRWK